MVTIFGKKRPHATFMNDEINYQNNNCTRVAEIYYNRTNKTCL